MIENALLGGLCQFSFENDEYIFGKVLFANKDIFVLRRIKDLAWGSLVVARWSGVSRIDTGTEAVAFSAFHLSEEPQSTFSFDSIEAAITHFEKEGALVTTMFADDAMSGYLKLVGDWVAIHREELTPIKGTCYRKVEDIDAIEVDSPDLRYVAARTLLDA